jgi:RNA polymerase sigma-70 factor (ECF subfamily)
VPEAEWVALVHGIAARDELALHALYERSHHIVFTLIMRILDDKHTAEELTLDVFHDVWRRASAYDAAGGSVVGWIMNQARSRAIDRHRFERRKKRVDPRPEGAVVDSVATDAGAALERRDRARGLRAALGVLSADERLAIESTFFAGLTYAEAAERLDQPLGTVKTRIRSGLRKLRAALAGDRREP